MIKPVLMPKKKPANPRPTQAELAKQLGLHQTTVSAILSGKDGASFSAETFQRVRKAARAMGYRPNRMARILRHGRSGVVGILHFGTILSHAKTRLAELSRAMLDAGFQPYICDLEIMDDGGRATINSLLDLRPEALILCGFSDGFDLSLLSELSANDVPIVSLGEIALPGVESFLPDRESVFESATAHLLGRGCKRVAVATRFSSGASFYREGHALPEAVIGYRRALARAGVPHDPELEIVFEEGAMGADIGGLGYRLGQQIIERFKPLPDGLACHNDLWAIGIMAAFREAGVRIPEDVAITGYGDDFFCPFLSPPLTSFATQVRRMAAAAATRTLEKIERTGDSPVTAPHYFPCDLVARQSTMAL